jgi:pimeloyl-ACP methyl ester carboxylesterase
MALREERGRLDAAGFAIEYLRLTPAGADPGAPTLVLLHQGLGCVEMWRGFPKDLAVATGLPVLAYSRRGYGRSDPYALPWSGRYMHDEALEMLPAVLEAAGIGRHILYGHSDGASISLIYAGGARAGLLGVVAEAPHVFVEQINVDNVAKVRKEYLTEGLRPRLAKFHGDNVDNAFFGWADAWLSTEFKGWDIAEYLPAIAVPVLVMQGEDDAYGTIAQCREIAGRVGGAAKVLMLPDCGHAPHSEQAEAVVNAVAGFAGGISQPAG